MATLKRVAEDTPRPIREIIPEVPEWLCNIIAKLQAKKPEDRFQSALEVADLLGRCLTSLEQGEPVVLEPSARLAERPAAVKSRGRRGWAFPAAVLLVLVGAITLTEATGVTNVRATVIRFFTGDGTRAGDGNDPGDGKLVVDVNAPGAKVVETKRSAEPSRSTLMAPWSNSTAWVIEGEELVQPDDSPGLHMLLFGDKSWTDYDFEAEVKITAGWQIAFDFRTTWQGQGMSAVIGRAGNTRHSIMETSGAHYREVCEVPGKTTIGRWYRVRVEARGNSFKMFLDGELLTSGYQEGFSRGRVGLSMNRVSARFRNLKVTAPDGKVLLEGVHNVLPRAKDARVSTGKDRPTFVTPWLDSDDWVIEGRDLVVTDGGRWHMLLLGDPSWADYNLEAEVKIVAGGSEVGLVFRARNPHHRLSAMLGGWGNTSHGLMTLSKAVAGGLRLVPGRTEKDRWYRVRVEARGNSFKMFLDGKLLTVGYHEDYPRGCVGLFAAPSSARFRNLKVTDPSGKVLLEGVPAVLPKAKDVAYREVGAALQDAVRLKSDNSEAHFALGSFHAQWGDWKKAAAEYDRGLELDPTSDFRLRQAAVVHAAYGDLEGYRRTCQKMFNRFRDTDDPLIAEGTARTCLLLPDAVSAADFDRVRKLAERGVTGTEKHGWYHYLARTKALADYRTEQYAEALKWLDRSAPKANGNHEDASMFAILSIVLHRLGRTKEAEVALAKAKAIIAKLPDTAPGRPFGNEWLAPVMAWLDCRQAESLLKKK
jgi:tetratricopeptide (TPR) repeat protein